MISRVHYGRLIVITVTGVATSEELRAAINAQWQAANSGEVALSARYKKVIESSQVRVYAIGGTSQTLPQTLQEPEAELDQIYRGGLALSLNNPGAPIAFSARHLIDGSLAHVGLAAEYVQPVSAIAGDVNQSYPVWDGRDGGAVNTGIDVAPGDQVSIDPLEGQIWSGVWAAGTHGPEGWPNWKAPAGAPAPNENAHCLIGRFGTGDWFKIGTFWSGENKTGSTGRLQLNINDDNPYNGDPQQKFNVNVRVSRKSAAAAGIYV